VDKQANHLRTLRARIGAHALHAQHDSRELTKKARVVFDARFYEGIPADLPQAERDRRAHHARKAYFARLALASAKARRKKAEP
jgi:hypothetical protein